MDKYRYDDDDDGNDDDYDNDYHIQNYYYDYLLHQSRSFKLSPIICFGINILTIIWIL